MKSFVLPLKKYHPDDEIFIPEIFNLQIRLKRKTSITSHQSAIRSNRLREEFQLINTSNILKLN